VTKLVTKLVYTLIAGGWYRGQS